VEQAAPVIPSLEIEIGDQLFGLLSRMYRGPFRSFHEEAVGAARFLPQKIDPCKQSFVLRRLSVSPVMGIVR